MAESSLNIITETEISLKNYKDIIQNIAKCHSQEIINETRTISIEKREFDIRKTVQSVRSLEQFKSFDQATFDEQVKTLDDSIKRIMNSSILVRDQGIKKLVPLTYEILSLIFVSTSEKFRQKFFHELVEYYYKELGQSMEKMSVIKVLDKENFDQQIKMLLPIVKFEVADQLLQYNDLKSQQLLTEIISNVTSYLQYPRLNREDIFLIVNNKLGSKQYKLISYELIPVDERNGHLGDYFKLKINVEFDNTEKILNLFAKFLTPKMEMMKELLKQGPSKKEEFFYMTYLSLLVQNGLKSLLDFSPKCYFSRLNDVLVLDDLISLGFTALTPNIKLNYDSLMFVVKKISKLHACSLILEEILSQKEGKNVTLFDIYNDYLQEVLFKRSNTFLKDSFEANLSTIHYLIERFPDVTKNIAPDELKERIDKGYEKLFELVKKSEKLKNTICHGDMYVGNMLFNFDSEGRCRDATLVDFQILRYCPPVQDLLFFIHQNSFKDVRDRHYKLLVDTYYEELSKHVENFNFDIAKIFPKEEFEESLIYMKPQAVFQSLFYSPINAIDPTLREEIFQNPELAKKYFGENKTALIDIGLEDEHYRRVLSGLIKDIVELCESGSL